MSQPAMAMGPQANGMAARPTPRQQQPQHAPPMPAVMEWGPGGVSPAMGMPVQQQQLPGIAPLTVGVPPGLGGGGYNPYDPNQQPQQMMGGFGSMDNMTGYGSMYGGNPGMMMQGSMMGSNMYNSMGPNGMMGVPPSMYGMGGPGPMYGMGGPGSMYGMGGPGSMYGMGSAYGSAHMGGRFGGSLYGGSFFGQTGSLYGQGGSLYGANDVGSVQGSMFGMGSMYECGRAHTSLGEVKKTNLGYSIIFGSQNLGSTASRRSSFYEDRDDEVGGGHDLLRANSSAQGRASEPKVSGMTRRAKTIERGEAYGESGMDSDDRTGSGPSAGGAGGRKRGITTVRVVPVDEDAEAPRSPTTASSPTLSTDPHIQTVAVVEKSTSAMPRVRVNGNTRVQVDVNGVKKDVTFGEVISYDAASKPELTLKKISEVLKHFLVGHNTAILITADKKASASVAATIRAMMKEVYNGIDRATSSNGAIAIAEITMGAVTKKADVKDLCKADATYSPIAIGGSPLYGPVMMDLVAFSTNSASLAAEKMVAGREVANADDAVLMASVVLRQVMSAAAGKGNTPEVLLSSLTIAIAADGDVKTFTDVANHSSDSLLAPVLRYAIGGSSVAAAVVCVADSSDNCLPLLTAVSGLGEVINGPPRSGNVTRFIDHTTKVYEELKEKAAKVPASEKDQMSRNVERLHGILLDYRNFRDKPETTRPVVYRPTRVVEERQDSVSSNKLNVQRHATPAVAVTPHTQQDVNTRGVGGAGPANTAVNPKNNIRAVVIADGLTGALYKVDEKALTVTVGGVTHSVDEVKQLRNVSKVSLGTTSATVTGKSLAEGFNAALFAIDSAKIAPEPFASPAWAVVREVVKAALDASRTNKHLRMCVSVVDEKVRCADLLPAKAPTASAPLQLEPLVLGSSPIFGPVVHNARLLEVTSEEAFGERLGEAAANLRSSGLWGTDTFVVLSLIHSFSLGNDCMVGCMTAVFTGANHALLDGIMDRTPQLHQLFRYGYSGTSVAMTTLSLSPSDDADWVTGALSTLNRYRTSAKRSVRRGSVLAFVDYTSNSVAARRERTKNVTDPAMIAENERLLAAMQGMMQSALDIINDPTTNLPNATITDAGSPRAIPSYLGNGAASPKSRSRPEPAAVSGDVPEWADRLITALVQRPVTTEQTKSLRLQDTEHTVYEVVNVANVHQLSPTAASMLLASSVRTFIKGRNIGIVAASPVYYTAATVAKEPALAAFSEIVAQAATRSEESKHRFSFDFTACVATQDEVLADLQAAGEVAPQQPLRLGRSPLWGARPMGLRNTSLNSSAALTVAIQEAFSRLTEDLLTTVRSGQAVLIANAVQRRTVKRDDGQRDVEFISVLLLLSGMDCPVFRVNRKTARTQLEELVMAAAGSTYSTMGLVNIGNEADAQSSTAMSNITRFVQNKRPRADRPQTVLTFAKSSAAVRTMLKSRLKDGAGPTTALELKQLETTLAVQSKVLEDFNVPLPEVPLMILGTSGDDSKANDAHNGSRNAPATAAAAAATVPVASAPRNNEHSTDSSSSSGARPNVPWCAPKDHRESLKVATVAVVNATTSLGGPVEVAAASKTEVNVFANGHKQPSTYLFGEVVDNKEPSRSPAQSVLDTESMVYLTTRLSKGNNGALFVTGLPGDKNSLETAYNLTRDLPIDCLQRAVKAIAYEKVSLYGSIMLIKDSAFKNMTYGTNGGVGFVPLETSTSPLFGPVCSTDDLRGFGDVRQFASAFAHAYNVAVEQDAAVHAIVVFKTELDRDVNLHSFFILSDPTGGREMAPVVSRLHSRERDLYSTALGGSCVTVGVLGLQASQDDSESLGTVLDAFQCMCRLRNGHLRPGSVTNFVNYARKAVKTLQDALEKTRGTPQEAEMSARFKRYATCLTAAESMLAKPSTSVPFMYPDSPSHK